MAATPRALKQWCLTKTETVTCFENWRHKLLYTLSLDAQFAPYLLDGATWSKKTKKSPLRGFTDDGSSVPEASRRTAQQKVSMLEVILGQIANYCPVISRNTIVKNSTSMGSIWSAIRLHFGFEATERISLIFQKSTSSTANDLRIFTKDLSLLQDNLLRNNSIQHHGAFLTEDEGMTPTLDKFIVHFTPTKGLR